MSKNKTTGTEIERKRQIDVGRAFKMRLAGLTYDEIALALNCSRSGVYDALQGFNGLLANPELLTTYRDNQVEIVDGIGAQITSILSNKLADKKEQEKLTPYQLMGMYGISFDKSRLLKGQSTVNLNSLSALVIGAAKDIAKGKAEPIDVTPGPELTPNPAVATRSEDDPASGISPDVDPSRIANVSEVKGE